LFLYKNKNCSVFVFLILFNNNLSIIIYIDVIYF
jgi:hypothetical protein